MACLDPLEQVSISVVSPVYMGEATVEVLVASLHSVLDSMGKSYEIILVDDGSPDSSWSEIQKARHRSERVRGLRLARNFGQHCAIFAGLQASRGDWIVVMDCDMQDRPDQLPKLLEESARGFDVVCGARVNRQDPLWKKVFSTAFYRLLSFLTRTEQDSSVANYGVYSRRAINAVLSMGDTVKFFPVMIQWVGFRRTRVAIEHSERHSGRSTYSLRALVSLGVESAISFSDRPLRLMAAIGMLVSMLSASLAVYYALGRFFGWVTEPGFATIIITIWFAFGFTVLCLGIIGSYLGRCFDQVKRRPSFIVSEEF